MQLHSRRYFEIISPAPVAIAINVIHLPFFRFFSRVWINSSRKNRSRREICGSISKAILFSNRICLRRGHASNLIFCISFENTPLVFVAYWKNNPTDLALARGARECKCAPIDKCNQLKNTRRTPARFRLNEICSAYVHKTPDLSFPTQRRNADYVPRMCTPDVLFPRNMRRDSTGEVIASAIIAWNRLSKS